jgi:DNA-directed RNA polymerase subunit RPC12/RpoP
MKTMFVSCGGCKKEFLEESNLNEHNEFICPECGHLQFPIDDPDSVEEDEYEDEYEGEEADDDESNNQVSV